MSDDDLMMMLVRWLFDAAGTGNAQGRPIEIAKVDTEAGVPAGTTARLLDQVLRDDGTWIVLDRKGSFIRLLHRPAGESLGHGA